MDKQFFYHKDEIDLALKLRFWLGLATGALLMFLGLLSLGLYLGV